MENEQEKKTYIQIERSEFEKLIRRTRQLSHMVLILEHLCGLWLNHAILPAKDLCEVTGLDPDKLRDYGNRRTIRSVKVGPLRAYGAYDFAELCEKDARRKVQRQLATLESEPDAPAL